MISRLEQDKNGEHYVRIPKEKAEKILKLLPSNEVRVDLSIPHLLDEVLKDKK